MNQNIYRWILLLAIVLAIILVPFLLFGRQIEVWIDGFIHSAANRPGWVIAVLGSLLAVDVLVPTPSSLISTGAGFVLGFLGGMATSWAGMTVGSLLGYWLGLRFGYPLADRLVGSDELKRFKEMSRRFGDWVIIVSRPVPVLAETSVLFAGMSEMPIARFLLLSALSNLGVSVVYAAVGAFSSTVNSFLLAFGGAILVPAITMILMRRISQNRIQEQTHH
jgi:uncharacterized membrane protein YdjX (TVP38/TMEM64 family)